MKTLKIYGERNTGTNYLTRLLRENVQFTELAGTVPAGRIWTRNELAKNLYFSLTRKVNGGWKHSVPDLDSVLEIAKKRNTGFITLSKNPYSFLLSLYRHPYHYKGDLPKTFEAFLNSPWRTQARDNTVARFDSPVELWNVKNSAYLELKTAVPNTQLLTYEHLLADPLTVVIQVKEAFELELKGILKNYEASTKDPDRSFDDYQKYYLNEEWKKELSEDAIDLITSRLDRAVVDAFDYELVCKSSSIQENAMQLDGFRPSPTDEYRMSAQVQRRKRFFFRLR